MNESAIKKCVMTKYYHPTEIDKLGHFLFPTITQYSRAAEKTFFSHCLHYCFIRRKKRKETYKVIPFPVIYAI